MPSPVTLSVQGISARISDENGSDAKIKRENVDDQGEKPNDSSSVPLAKDDNLHRRKVHSCSFSDSERSSDVKLFGQILTHSSSSENGNGNQHKFKGRLKINSHGNLCTANKGPPGQEDASARSYGIWDGTRLHAGLPSLPDPTTLLSRYPTFDGFSKSASPIQQQQPICNV